MYTQVIVQDIKPAATLFGFSVAGGNGPLTNIVEVNHDFSKTHYGGQESCIIQSVSRQLCRMWIFAAG